MAKYEVNGQRYEFPDTTNDDEAWASIQADQQAQQGSANSNQGQTPVEPSSDPNHKYKVQPNADPDNLQYDKDYLAASKIVHDALSPTPWDKKGLTDKDLADYGFNTAGALYNSGVLAVAAAGAHKVDPEKARALLHLIEQRDANQYSMKGFRNWGVATAMDPLTWVGLGTFGLGFAGKEGLKVAGTEAIKQALKQAVKTGVQTGVEGAAQGAATSVMEQSIGISAGEQKGLDGSKVAKSAALTGAMGFGLGAAGHAIGEAVAPLFRGETTTVRDTPVEPTVSSVEPVQEVPATHLPESVETPPTVPAAPLAEAPKVDGEVGVVDEASIPPPEAPVSVEPPIEVPTNSADAVPEVKTDVKPEPKVETPVQTRVKQILEESKTRESGLRDATEKLLDEFSKATDPKEKADLYDILAGVREADTRASGGVGTELGGRVGMTNTTDFRAVTRDSILKERGINDPALATEAEKAAALETFHERLLAWKDEIKNRAEVTEYDQKIQQAFDSGDTAQAQSLANDKRLVEEKLADADPQASAANKVVNGINEYVISTVFTPKTVVANALYPAAKMLYKPLLDAYIHVGEKGAVRTMLATYSTMFSHSGVSLRGAMASFKYEKSLLFQDTNKLLEHDPVFSRMYGGGVLRMFPRMLTFTDELFGQMSYRGFVVSSAMSDAYEAGAKQGLKGDALHDFAKTYGENELNRAFEPKADAPKVIDFLRKQGMDRGMSGEKLDNWVKVELDKNSDLFRQALSESGRNYAADLAFKRDFSGEGVVSERVKDYEAFTARNPWMRLMGQLFLRTPIRVLEEGFRLTPGLNLVTPHFIRDLRGLGPAGVGGYAQVRAHGELLLSHAIGSSVLAAYAMGTITGGGIDDWKGKRTQQDGKFEPYTLYIGNTKVHYRNYDPISTPLKIMVNLLDKLTTLQVRRAQGEFVGKEEQQIAALMSVAGLSVAQTIRDANLWEGLNELAGLTQDVLDPETRSNSLIRFLGQKLQLVVPNVKNKVELQRNPVMTDPSTIEQFIRAKWNPNDPLVPKRYDAMGYPDTQSNPVAALTGLDFEFGKKGEKPNVEPKRLAVNEALAKITVATGKAFIAPFDAAAFSGLPNQEGMRGVDLRTRYTSDGKETYYDRLQRYVSALPIQDALHAALVDNTKGSMGVKGVPGVRYQLAHEIISKFRTAAYLKLMREEHGISDANYGAMLEKGKAQSGQKDIPFLPY